MGIPNILLEISIYSAVICIVIMLVKKLLGRHLSPALHYAVWALLIVRLMLPVTVDSGVHLLIIPSSQAQAAQTDTDSGIGGSVSGTNTAPDAVVSADAVGFPTQPEQGAVAVGQPIASHLSVANILVALWLAGVGVGAGYIIISYAVTKRFITRGAKVEPRVSAMFDECKRQLGISRKLRVMTISGIASPALFFPNTVLMPADSIGSMSDMQLDFALRHELTHYRRKDHIVSFVLVLLQVVYWFNPFVWLAFRQMRLDIEVACDNRVVSSMNTAQRRAYAATVLAMFSAGQPFPAMLGMAIVQTRTAAEKRIRGMFAQRSSTHKGRLMAVLLSGVLLLTCFTTACQPTPEEPIINQKNEVYQESEGTEAITAQDIGVPDRVKETVELSDKLTLDMDAAVALPANLNAYKVYKGILTNFTQEQVSRFAQLLPGDTVLTGYDGRMTKDELTEYFLLPAQQTLAELKNGTYVKDPNLDSDTPTIESTEANIEIYKQCIEEAPEERSDDKVSIENYAANGNYFYGEFPITGSEIIGKFMVGEGNRNQYGGMSYYNSGFDLIEPYNLHPSPAEAGMALPEGGLGLSTTPEQAVQLATELRNNLGANELDFYAIMQASAWVEEMGIGDIDAYYVIFTRRLDDIPVLYVSANVAISGYDRWQAFEKLVVTVDDTGVIAVNWMGNTEITGILAEHPVFLPFDQVLAALRGQVTAQNRYILEGEAGDPNVAYQTVTITSVSLEYLRMKEPNGGEGDVRFVPAWVFRGNQQTVYTDEAKKEKPYLLDNEEIFLMDTPYVINALDGSAFDPRYLDGIEMVGNEKPQQ